MPDKKVEKIDAGIGGTTSDYGAMRFYDHVLKYEPDMVVIEFSANDANYPAESFHKSWLESMIRQCLKAKKKSYILYVHAPNPIERNPEKTYFKGIDWKNQILSAYNITSVNVYEYAERKFRESGKETFTEYLADFYKKSGDGYDVHGGYKLYAEAISEVLNESYDEIMQLPKNRGVVYQANSAEINAKYTQLGIKHPRMHYTKGWEIYSEANKLVTNDSNARIPENRYWIYPEGIRYSYKNGNTMFGFNSSADAFCVSFFSMTAGATADVLIDDKKVDTISTYSQYSGQSYTTKWIELPSDGKEHRVVIDVQPPSDDRYCFAFGSIYEKNY